MKINPGFCLREVCGEHVVIPEGEENINLSKFFALNESATVVWKAVADKPQFSLDDVAAALMQEYDVDQQTALADSRELMSVWEKEGILNPA